MNAKQLFTNSLNNNTFVLIGAFINNNVSSIHWDTNYNFWNIIITLTSSTYVIIAALPCTHSDWWFNNAISRPTLNIDLYELANKLI